jgi:RNA polymerase sigma-70 factor (ECF subfamily)
MNVEQIHRDHYGRILATVIRLVGDFDRSEEAVQEAFAVAIESWPAQGTPQNPVAWLVSTARFKAIDQLRREARQRAKQDELERHLRARAEDETPVDEDQLRLIFTCCHPALEMDARVALTLRTLGGLTTPQIARAFLVSEPTMAKRIVRAKSKIRDAAIPYRVPPPELLPERLPGVLAVLYLVFNEGYATTTSDELVRVDLCDEAIRLARILVELMPEEAEAMGLLALMLLHHSRRETRTTSDGELVLLEDQDRARWDHAAIDDGLALLDRVFAMGHPGPYAVQGAIAALHTRAPRPEDTDWPQIVGLYATLYRMQPSAIVQLNWAVAVAMADGPAAAFPLLDPLEAELDRYHLFHSARANLFRRLDRLDEAEAGYRRALELATNPAERRFLERRLEEVAADP